MVGETAIHRSTVTVVRAASREPSGAAPVPPLTGAGVAARLALLLVAASVAFAGLFVAAGASAAPRSGASTAPAATRSTESVGDARRRVEPAAAEDANAPDAARPDVESESTEGDSTRAPVPDAGADGVTETEAEAIAERANAEIAAEQALSSSGSGGYPPNPYSLPTDSGGYPITGENAACSGAWSVGYDYGAGCTQFENYVEQGLP